MFPDGFFFGTATSSHQVEGGNRHNDWWDWEQRPGAIADGTRSGDAAAWWDGKAEEDLALAASLGQNAHRMSLEWSRLEPEPGRFDPAAFARYRQIIDFARSQGLSILLTLNHFTLPRWVAKLGGWSHPAASSLFEGFADRAARELGDRVALWATLNEPSVLAWMGYAGDRWPPGRKSLPAAFVAIRRMLGAHARARNAVRRVIPSAQVGLVINMPWFVPADPTRRLDRWAAAMQDWAFSGCLVHALEFGQLRFPLVWGARSAPELRGSFDWLGLNYYGRYDVRFDPRAIDAAFGRHVQQPTVRTEHNDWGQPSPRGMVQQLERLARLGAPLYVTENGTFDPEDVRKPAFLIDHVAALEEAIHGGLDVRGYFAWSLVDNFEWAEGWATPFGLLALDRATQRRSSSASAETYAAICRARGIPVGSEGFQGCSRGLSTEVTSDSS